MKYFDVNVSIGGWPFRHVPRHTIAELREDLEALDCGGALVANNGAILYNESHNANLELAEAIAAHRDFFRGCATIDPTWPQAEKELEFIFRDLHFPAVRLLPRYHGYPVAAATELAKLAGRLGMIVVLPMEIVNFRQRHRLEPETALSYDEMTALADCAPETVFVWLDAVLPAAAPANVYGEFNRYLPDCALHERLLYGSGMPLRSPAALAKCEVAFAGQPQAMRQVLLDNFRKLFGPGEK